VLDERAPEPDCLAAAVRVSAQLHARFAEHPLLAECRLLGGDYGVGFYTASVRDATRCLGALERSPGGLHPERAAVCARLLGRLRQLRDEGPARAQALNEFGGPETLLHGDLWPKNVLVCPGAGGPRVRLIDWDRAGVGPVSYDLSTFLSRCPASERPGLLELYREATRHLGWRWPSAAAWNVLFETAEQARLANCIIWRARDACEGHAEWAFQELASLERWLEELQPILPVGRPGAS
jgi:Ser/Thr protein kinase RdoA (MazF antagonist)